MKRQPDAPEFLSELDEQGLVEEESDRLRQQAKRWGVEIPDEFLVHAEDDSLFIGGAYHERMALKIRDAKRETIKFWVGSVAIPLLGALTGLAGAIIGILSFLKRR